MFLNRDIVNWRKKHIGLTQARLLLMCRLLTIFVGPATLGVHAVVLGTFYVCHQLLKLKENCVYKYCAQSIYFQYSTWGCAREGVTIVCGLND
jgi:hypothetical protein